MKVSIALILLLAGCATHPPTFPNCPDKPETPKTITDQETVRQFAIRIELAREDVVKRLAACSDAVTQMQHWAKSH